MKNTTESRLNTMPFARTSPISKPMLNRMVTRARNPTMVVRLLAKIELMASSTASSMASSSDSPVSRQRINASSRKME